MIPVPAVRAARSPSARRILPAGMAAGLLALWGVALATPAAAQYYRYPDADPYGALPPRYVPLPRGAVLPPGEIRNIVFRMGYRQVSQPIMQGRSYVLRARDEYGPALLRIDAFTGRVVSAQPLRGGETIAVPGAPPPPARAAPQRAPAPRAPSVAARPSPPRPEAPAAAPAEAPLPPKRPEVAAVPASPEAGSAAPAAAAADRAPEPPPVAAPAAASPAAAPAASSAAPAVAAKPEPVKPDPVKPEAAKPAPSRPAGVGAGTATGAASAGSASVLSRPAPRPKAD